MASKIYVIVERGYEYNDEYMQSLESDSYVIPSGALKSKKKADEECLKKNLDFLKSLYEDSYNAYCMSNTFNLSTRKINDILNLSINEDDYDNQWIKSLTDDQKIKLINLGVRLYEVKELEIS